MKLQSFIDQKRREFARKKKLIKRKALFLKVKIFFTCVLPVVIVLLAVKVVQTLARMEIRKAASNALGEVSKNHRGNGKKSGVVQTAKKPEFVTPVPVGTAKAGIQEESFSL